MATRPPPTSPGRPSRISSWSSRTRVRKSVHSASLVLVFTYPLTKRVTFWPQFVLGLAFNWGAWLGWAAVRGDLGWAPALLYIGGIFWTLGYDTIYAHQDRKDDPAAGVKSSARALGLSSKPWLMVFYIAASALFLAAGIGGRIRNPLSGTPASVSPVRLWPPRSAVQELPHHRRLFQDRPGHGHLLRLGRQRSLPRVG